MKNWMLGACLIVLGPLAGCTTEQSGYSVEEFSVEMAQASCSWLLTCCDVSEQGDFQVDASSETACVRAYTDIFDAQFAQVGAERWNEQAARSCVKSVLSQVESCPRSFFLANEIAACELVDGTQGPGDFCEDRWDCTTRFCKNGVCANPLPEGAACVEGEPCQSDLRCIQGSCRALQPDGAACELGTECVSGACGGGKCITSRTYTCDGQ